MQVTTGDVKPPRFISQMTLISGISVLVFSILVIWFYGYFEKRDLLLDKMQLHQQTLQSMTDSSVQSLEHWNIHFQNPLYLRQKTYVSIQNSTEDQSVLISTIPPSLESVFKTSPSSTPNAYTFSYGDHTVVKTVSTVTLDSKSLVVTLFSDATEALQAIQARQVRIGLLLLALQSLLIALFWFFARKGDQKLEQSEKEQQAMENELFFLAHYDTITHLPNRTLFWERLDAATSRGGRLGKSVVLLLLDLKQFTILNEQYGRSVGDLVLVEAARRLQASTRTADLICRIGPDEFAIILEDMDINSNADPATLVLQNIRQQFQIPFDLTDEEQRSIEFVCGGAEFPQDGLSSEDLLAHAQIALNCAKKMGHIFLFFEQTKNQCPAQME